MPEILKPDMKALVWLAAGYILIPLIMRNLSFSLPGSKSAE